MTNLEKLNENYPELVKEYSEMSKEELLEQICAEVLDLHMMDERVQTFMNECTLNLSKTTYTIESIKSMIVSKQEQDIIDFCEDEVNGGQTDKEIAESIRDRAANFS